jgi:hypothetical protein
MAAAYTFKETYGTVGAPTRATASKINLLSANIASGSDTSTVPAANPITINASGMAYSYERWLQGNWETGTGFNSVSNVKFWKVSGSLGTGVAIKAGDVNTQVFATPINTVSLTATSDVPTVEGSALALGYSANYSDYVILQLAVNGTLTPSSGSIGTMSYRMKWDEA